jgi:hypothetical protein
VIAVIAAPSIVQRTLMHLGILGDADPPRGPWPCQAGLIVSA